MARYLNASDVPKLLGKKYSFLWSTDEDKIKIVKGEKKDTNLNFETCSQSELGKLFESFKVRTFKNATPESIEKSMLKRKLHISRDPEKNIKKLRVYELTKAFEENKNVATEETLFKNYDIKKNEVISKLPDVLKTQAIDTFAIHRGIAEEDKILNQLNVKKTNKLEYLCFDYRGCSYKIGCRFDGPGIEIKTRKTKFLGVPDYEKVQITLYMAVSGKSEWKLVEKFQDNMVEHIVDFDNSFFEKIKSDIHYNWEYFENLKNF